MMYNAQNYMAHGGKELVIGGKLTFLPGATVEGAERLFDAGLDSDVKPGVVNSTAATVAALREDFNGLLGALAKAGVIAVVKQPVSETSDAK